jgi:hypothetical protein
MWEEEAPEVPGQADSGLRYGKRADGAVGYDPALARRDLGARQRDLHGFLLEDSAGLSALFAESTDYVHDGLLRKLERYRSGLGNGPDGINPAVVWKVGNDLRLALEADAIRRPHDTTNAPNFNADQYAGLKGLVATHNVFVALMPDLAELDGQKSDPARQHVAERDAALLQAAIDAFSAQVRLIMAEVTDDLRDLFHEAQGNGPGADRADVITQESVENLIKVIVAEAIAQQRGESLLSKVVGDSRAAVVGGAVGSAITQYGPAVATTFGQLVVAIQPQIGALMSAWHGAGYPVKEAADWVVARMRDRKDPPP